MLAYLKDAGVCFHSIFNFEIFWSNHCCLSGDLPRFTTKSMHREVKVKRVLMTRECKYPLMPALRHETSSLCEKTNSIY